MPLLLEQDLIQKIADIGKLRLPNEACGILLPREVNGVQAIELPNRSKTSLDSFELRGSDILLALRMAIKDMSKMDEVEEMLDDLTVWHTHPQGNVGPSRSDMKNRHPQMNSLVISLYPDKPPVATWY